ncbi:hypothetical protein GDO78_020513 [Eleutherodactylus coqui]|uniref:Transmembrane protein n=1 Tax=Eleutherodactylus coqui TaxID=57060 RepID=A0A8J6EHR2_ELECQ|nr:hypothetical protein GDO78_020513 [Eleutherodactylus coqui]
MNLPCGKDTVKCADTCAKTSFIVQKCCSKLRNCAYIRVMPLKGQFYAKQRLRAPTHWRFFLLCVAIFNIGTVSCICVLIFLLMHP